MRTHSLSTKNILPPEAIEFLRKTAEDNANHPENKQQFIKSLTGPEKKQNELLIEG